MSGVKIWNGEVMIQENFDEIFEFDDTPMIPKDKETKCSKCLKLIKNCNPLKFKINSNNLKKRNES